MRIAVLMGGPSAERKISMKTGNAVLKSLQKTEHDVFPIILDDKNIIQDLVNNKFDFAFIALHGEYGEDGRIQALLDIMKIPYSGSNYLSSAIAMNKIKTKNILKFENIRMAKTYESVIEVDKYPVIIKPISGGSSIDIKKCENKAQLIEGIKNIQDFMIEEFINGEEVTVGVLNKEPLGVVKIKPKEGFYDYNAKYTKGKTEFEIPAKISEELYNEIMSKAKLVSETLELDGGIRVDFIIKDENAYFLEVNSIPGMTELSLLPKCASLKGLNFDDLVKKMI